MKTDLTAQTLTRIFKQDELDLLNMMYPLSGYLITTEFSRQDAINTMYKQIAEVKVRTFSWNDFQQKYKGEFLIEKEKYDSLMYAANQLKYIPVYCFGFKVDNKLVGYSAINFRKISLENVPVQIKQCPKSQWDKTLVPKPCYLIPSYLLNKSNLVTKHYA